LRLVDFILRRTLLGFSHDQGQSAVDRVLLLLEQELAWSPERTSAELSLYQNHISMTQAFRDEAQA
jgi:glycerol-3-phosphate dehydrogenase